MREIVLITLFASLLLVGAISNQSFGVTGHQHVLDWGEFGFTKDGKLFKPQNLAADDEQNIYVTDSGNARVQKFTSDGKFLLSWGTNGKEDGQFLIPAGIATFENFVYVLDEKQYTVQKFDSDGNFILKWGEFGSKSGEFSSPKGIEVDSNGIVYVADTKNHRIQQFTADGEFISSFGKYGFTDGGLKTPIDIAINGNFIYVSDPGNNKIEKYTSDGIFLKTFDNSFAGRSITPGGLVTDPDGNIYLVDSINQRILKIDSEGNTITVWGTLGNGKGKFLQPTDLVLDNLDIFLF